MMKKFLTLAVAGATGFGTMGANLAPASALPALSAAQPASTANIIPVQGTFEWQSNEGGTNRSHGRSSAAPRVQFDGDQRGGRDNHDNREAERRDQQRRDDARRAEQRRQDERQAERRHDQRRAEQRRDDRRYDDRRYDNRRRYDNNHRWRGERRYHEGRYWRPADDGWYVYNDGAWIAAGALGLAAGAMLGATMAQPQAPATVQSGAPVTQNGIPPWTPAWYQYCSGKYKSFNAQTGLYLGYDGKYHYCR